MKVYLKLEIFSIKLLIRDSLFTVINKIMCLVKFAMATIPVETPGGGVTHFYT